MTALDVLSDDRNLYLGMFVKRIVIDYYINIARTPRISFLVILLPQSQVPHSSDSCLTG